MHSMYSWLGIAACINILGMTILFLNIGIYEYDVTFQLSDMTELDEVSELIIMDMNIECLHV